MMTKDILSTLGDLSQEPEYGQGKPYVYDDAGVRRLHFDSAAVQSSMRLSDPYALDLSYTQAMMGFLLFSAEPRHILIVGLGGGSLSKYCHHQFPQARITTLEINQHVIALRDEFLIPPDSERFQIVHTDAVHYMARSDIQADVILLDGYDIRGLPDDLCTQAFYSHCWRALSAEGVLVANLWGGVSPERGVYLQRLRGIFSGRVWWSRPRHSSSLIAFALKNERYYPQWSRLMLKAQKLGERYHLDLPRVAKDMRLRPDPEQD